MLCDSKGTPIQVGSRVACRWNPVMQGRLMTGVVTVVSASGMVCFLPDDPAELAYAKRLHSDGRGFRFMHDSHHIEVMCGFGLFDEPVARLP